MNFRKRRFLGNVPMTTEDRTEKEPLLKKFLESHEEDSSTRSFRSNGTDNIWSWLVALGLFFMNFMILGIGRMSSLLYLEYMDLFSIDRNTASAPYSLQVSLRKLIGPIAAILGQWLDISTITVLGCLTAAAGAAACHFVKDMTMLIVLWGAVYGLGSALTGYASFILIDQYFIKYRSSATGFVISGAPLGAIFFTTVLEIVIQKYTIRGMFLLAGSLILFVIPIAMVLQRKYRTKSPTPEAPESNGKYSSLSDVEDSCEIDKKHSSPSDTEKDTTYDPKNNYFPDTDITEKQPEEGNLEVPVPSTSQQKDFNGKKSDEILNESDEIGLMPLNKDSCENLEGMPSNYIKHKDKTPDKNLKSSPKEKKKSKKGNGRTITVKFKESKNSESSNVETSIEIPGKVNSSGDWGRSNITETPKETYNENLRDLPKSVETEIPQKHGTEDESKKEFERSSIYKTQHKEVSVKKSKDRKRTKKSNASKVYKESSLKGILKRRTNYENLIKFKTLHENIDLVLDLLTNKIPLDDEEEMPSSREITQSILDSSDTEFISKELQRIEYYFQLPDVEVEQFLTDTQEKLKKFNESLNADRKEFLKQKKLDFEGKELVYKDIRNTTIRKPDCTVEITEYSFEIPVQLYIPLKLQEINQRSSERVASYYSEDKRVLKVLKQLKRLNKIFSTPTYSTKYSPEKLLKSSTFSRMSTSDTVTNQYEEYENIFRNHIRTALNIHGNPMFLLICLCHALTMLTFFPVVASVVEYTIDKGMRRSEEIYVIAVLSAGDLIGRLCTGWFTDKVLVSDKNYMAVALILSGISTVLLPIVSNRAMLLPAIWVFAVFQGSLYMKHPVILVKYLQEHEKKIGLGFMSFFAGIIGLVIPFYIGYFRDQLGSYDRLYYINASLSAFFGFVWFMEPYLLRFVPATREGNNLEGIIHFT